MDLVEMRKSELERYTVMRKLEACWKHGLCLVG